MRNRIIILLIAVMMISMMAGCSLIDAENVSADVSADVTEPVIEKEILPIKEAEEYDVKIYSIDPNAVSEPGEESIPDESVPMAESPASDGIITSREAEAIALQEAGFAHDQISFLYTKSKVDEEIPHYIVSFHGDGTAYEFMIHAETGEILSP